MHYRVSYQHWVNSYTQQIYDLYQIFLDGVGYQDKYYSEEFFRKFVKLLYQRSSGIISKFI